MAPGGGGRLTLASGGHLPPILLRASGAPEVAECRGTLLGVEREARTADCLFTLDPGDALVLYTDGTTEARVDRPLDPAALASALQPVLGEGAAALARRAVAVAEERANGTLRDDVAVLVLRATER
jgi:serine phosphatase RsbU (regulator of sigma subunit)